MNRLCTWFTWICLLWPLAGWGHVGSKDVFEEAKAGPYQLYVTVRPPNVIPGVAQVEVRVSGQPVQQIEITQLPLTGEASKYAPSPDRMKRSSVDPNFFTGAVWMMLAGSMQVRFHVTGDGGSSTTAVPVLANALTTLKMQRSFGIVLGACGLILILGMGGIMGAAAREAMLKPGLTPTPSLRRRGLVVSLLTVLFAFALVWLGDKWWNIEAAEFAGSVYRPLATAASVQGSHLRLLVSAHASKRDGQSRSNQDFIPDHGKIMHLYAVREPELDAIYHLHPSLVSPGDFELDLPVMPPGEYRLYGDVVHANGFPETLVTTVHVPPGMSGRRLDADDASGAPAPLSAGVLGTRYRLPDGYGMQWDRPLNLTANTAYVFHFTLLDPKGNPPARMRSYLGMAGHAAFLKTDGTVFAHVHPEGSAAMAAVMIASADAGGFAGGGMAGMSMPGDFDLKSNAVEFPYGFPSAGRYRIFVQMKHDSTVETGTFDAVVAPGGGS